MLAHSSGLIFASNCTKSGGVSIISPNNNTIELLSTNAQKPIKPNGIALEPNGSFLLAHLGDKSGGIFRLSPDGRLSSVVTHANGRVLPPTNFITIDSIGRLWITVSTTIQPRTNDYRSTANSGFIAMAEPGQSDARIVADNLGYANECVVDTNNNYVYVNETFGRCLTRFNLAPDGTLSKRHVLTTFSIGTYPDGLTMVENGNLFVTSIVSNRVIEVSPDGGQKLILEDADKSFVELAESAYRSDSLDGEHLASTGNTRLGNLSSLAFGGSNRSTAYLGNLLDSCVYRFETNARGVTATHWDTPLGYLEKFVTDPV